MIGKNSMLIAKYYQCKECTSKNVKLKKTKKKERREINWNNQIVITISLKSTNKT